jgi:hypothetical protein
MRSWILYFPLFLAFVGCAPAIGDSCSTAYDCSITGNRICDTAVPSGACTIYGCEDGTCPDDAVCVRFRPEESRLTFTACMKRCEDRGNCRVDDGFDCVSAETISDPSNGELLAEVVDSEPNTFCIATEPSEL